ncbi:MAG: hypothetical protein V3T72_02865 [Thermoanaerobaculia bacterium]
MADRKLEGKVIDTQGRPVAGSDVWLFCHGGSTEQQSSGASGEFSFDLNDTDAWPEGAATLGVRPADSPLVEEKRVQLPETGSPPHQLVNVHAKDEISATSGWLFLTLTIGSLLLLGFFYLDLHGVTAAKLRQRQPIAVEQTSQLSVPLADMLNTAKQQVASARESVATQAASEANEEDASGGQEDEGATGEGATGESEIDGDTVDENGAVEQEGEGGEASDPQQPLQDAMVDDSLKTAAEIFAELKKSRVGLLGADKIKALDGLFAQADTALAEGAIDALDATLDRLLAQVEEERSVFLWEDSPGRLLEVMFWALAATLLRLIFDTGYYLYKSSFLKSAIPHHSALVVIIPIVAVIIAFVLTLVRVDMQLGENVLTLDMGNVLIAILVAVLIGLAPWKSWNFLYRLADLLFTTLSGFFKIADQAATTK